MIDEDNWRKLIAHGKTTELFDTKGSAVVAKARLSHDQNTQSFNALYQITIIICPVTPFWVRWNVHLFAHIRHYGRHALFKAKTTDNIYGLQQLIACIVTVPVLTFQHVFE